MLLITLKRVHTSPYGINQSSYSGRECYMSWNFRGDEISQSRLAADCRIDVCISSEVAETDCAQFSWCKHPQTSKGLYTSTRPSARKGFIEIFIEWNRVWSLWGRNWIFKFIENNVVLVRTISIYAVKLQKPLCIRTLLKLNIWRLEQILMKIYVQSLYTTDVTTVNLIQCCLKIISSF